jgi:CubicO group peptidase (beta-lactamase class C family)
MKETFCSLFLVLIIFSLALSTSFAAGYSPETGFDEAAVPIIDKLCQDIIDNGNTSGVALLIGRGDNILMRKVYGNRMNIPQVEPMTFDTIFDLASITKASATASAIMLLIQDGTIKMDDPVNKYLPGYAREDMKDITIKHLLTHTSGLAAYTNANTLAKLYGPKPNPFGLIKRISELDRKAAPGEKYIYSCLNYLTLARIAAEVSGKTTHKILQEKLWDPLGMKNTTFFPDDEQIARCAPTGYNKNTNNVYRGKVHDPLAAYSNCEAYSSGNAGAFSTIDDMSKYARMILNGGSLNGVEIFKPEIWELISTNQSFEGLRPRTCGWGIGDAEDGKATDLNNTPETCTLSHTGYTGTMIWMDKLSKAYVIVFTNCVYPVDKTETKRPVWKARNEIVRMVINHIDVYKDHKNEVEQL